MERNFDEKPFIPVIKQPIKIVPKRSKWRRKVRRTPEKDTPPMPIRGQIIFQKAA
jgi:hypothetical protein